MKVNNIVEGSQQMQSLLGLQLHKILHAFFNPSSIQIQSKFVTCTDEAEKWYLKRFWEHT